jgi:uncharacterized protein YkvS
MIHIKKISSIINESSYNNEFKKGDIVEVVDGVIGIGIIYKIENDVIYVDLGGIHGSLPTVVKKENLKLLHYMEIPEKKIGDIITILQSIILNS